MGGGSICKTGLNHWQLICPAYLIIFLVPKRIHVTTCAFFGKNKIATKSHLSQICHSQNILPRSVIHIAMMVRKTVTSAKQYNCQKQGNATKQTIRLKILTNLNLEEMNTPKTSCLIFS